MDTQPVDSHFKSYINLLNQGEQSSNRCYTGLPVFLIWNKLFQSKFINFQFSFFSAKLKN